MPLYKTAKQRFHLLLKLHEHDLHAFSTINQILKIIKVKKYQSHGKKELVHKNELIMRFL